MANTVLLQTFHRESRAVITFRFGTSTVVPDRMNGLHTVPALVPHRTVQKLGFHFCHEMVSRHFFTTNRKLAVDDPTKMVSFVEEEPNSNRRHSSPPWLRFCFLSQFLFLANKFHQSITFVFLV